MKIQHQNDTELLITDSGLGAIFIAATLLIMGVAIGAALLFVGNFGIIEIALSIGLIIAAAIVMLTAKKRHITLRKNATSEILETNIVTKKGTKREFPTNSIASVNIETATEYSRNSRGTGMSRSKKSTLFLAFTDTSRVSLTSATTSANSYMGDMSLASYATSPLSLWAETIGTFLGVPVVSDVPSVGVMPGFGTPSTTTGQPVIAQPPAGHFASNPQIQQPSAPPAQPVTPPTSAPAFDVIPTQATLPPAASLVSTPPDQQIR